MNIEKLALADFELFLDYLNDHLSDNGRDGTAYFQPLPRADSRFPVEKADGFKAGMGIEVGQPGWRRVWVARDVAGQIAGHIDLRGHPERHTGHRCLLGMGVDRAFRQQGLGGALLAHAAQWALVSGIQWIDLQVLSVNTPAINLYQRHGYRKTGEIPNMFHIDGHYFSYTSMTTRLR
jgi:ribosomal protein S18 acetylase RimI-like enzyme